jgi:predicted nucleic acid-binding protein
MILDTSILVEIDRVNNMDRIEKLDNEGSHSISAVTVSEFYTGVKMREEPEEYREKNDRLDMGRPCQGSDGAGWLDVDRKDS